MNILQIIAEVLSEAAKDENIPDVRFKNNSLNDEVIRLTGPATAVPADDSNEKVVNRFIAEISGAVDQETGEATDFEDVIFSNEVCEKISDAIASKMKTATSKLRTIHSEVSTLSGEISAEYNRFVAADPFLARHVEGADDADFNFPKMRYDVIDDIGGIKNTSSYIITEAEGDEGALTQASKFIFTVGKFAARKLKDEMVGDVKVPADVRKEVIGEIYEDNSDFLIDNLDTAIKVITSSTSLKALKNRIVRTIEKDSPLEVTISCLSTVADYRKSSKVIAAALDEKGFEIPEANLEFMTDLTDLCLFAAQWHRVNTFSNTVMFRNKTLNPDLMKDLEAKQLTLKDVAQHMKYRYKDYELPNIGITLSTLVQSKERIDADVAKYESQNKVRVEAGLHDAQHNAFMKIMSDYLGKDENKEKVGSVSSLRSYLVKCANKITNEGASVEDVIYVVMEKLLYPGDFVMVLREQLGISYAKEVASSKELSADDVASVNAVVYARMITEYMKDNFMEQ